MRLTHNIRVEIIRNAMALRFDKLEKALRVEERILGAKVYDFFVPPPLAAAIKTVEDSKLAFFHNKSTTFHASVDSTNVDLSLEGMARVLPLGWHPFTMHTRDEGAKGKLAKEVWAFYNKRREWEDERTKAKQQLMVLLKSVYSTESLAKVWPEGAKLYSSPPLPKVVAGLPAVQMADLNKQLGLVA